MMAKFSSNPFSERKCRVLSLNRCFTIRKAAIFYIFISFSTRYTYCRERCLSSEECHWYGKGEKYLCHCMKDVQCDKENGKCPGSSAVEVCAKGWFGPACQFVSSPFDVTSLTLLQEENDSTCFEFQGDNSSTAEPIEVFLVKPQYINWIRLVIKSPAQEDDFDFSYTQSNPKGHNEVEKPLHAVQSIRLDDKTLDYSFKTNEPIENFIIDGIDLRNLCTIHIYGGRNIAMATGGKDENHCYELLGDEGKATGLPIWCRKFNPTVQIFSVELHKTVAHQKGSTLKFILQGYVENKSRVFEHRGVFKDNQEKYVIPFTTAQAIWAVHIRPTDSGFKQDETSLGVVRIFGERLCEELKYGVECENECHCLNDTACWPTTGTCPHGCGPGYLGHSCKTKCPAKTYGLNCKEKCKRECSGQLCNHVNGHCLRCSARREGLFCENQGFLRSYASGTGVLVSGIVVGVFLVACIIFFVILITLMTVERKKKGEGPGASNNLAKRNSLTNSAPPVTLFAVESKLIDEDPKTTQSTDVFFDPEK